MVAGAEAPARAGAPCPRTRTTNGPCALLWNYPSRPFAKKDEVDGRVQDLVEGNGAYFVQKPSHLNDLSNAVVADLHG